MISSKFWYSDENFNIVSEWHRSIVNPSFLLHQPTLALRMTNHTFVLFFFCCVPLIFDSIQLLINIALLSPHLILSHDNNQTKSQFAIASPYQVIQPAQPTNSCISLQAQAMKFCLMALHISGISGWAKDFSQ